MTMIEEIKSRAIRINEEQERELFTEYKKTGSIKAKNKIMESQYLQVVNISRKYAAAGFDVEDIISEGMIGLSSAVEIHDPGRARFNTIAFKYIRGYILQSLYKYRFQGAKQGSYAHNKKFDEAHEDIDNGADIDAVAKKYGVTKVGILDHINAKKSKLPLEGIDLSGVYETPIEYTLKQEMTRDILRHLDNLSKAQRDSIVMFYGIGIDKRYTMEQIAKKIGKNTSAVKMTVKKGIDKLRRLPKKYLHEYMEG